MVHPNTHVKDLKCVLAELSGVITQAQPVAETTANGTRSPATQLLKG